MFLDPAATDLSCRNRQWQLHCQSLGNRSRIFWDDLYNRLFYYEPTHDYSFSVTNILFWIPLLRHPRYLLLKIISPCWFFLMSLMPKKPEDACNMTTATYHTSTNFKCTISTKFFDPELSNRCTQPTISTNNAILVCVSSWRELKRYRFLAAYGCDS